MKNSSRVLENLLKSFERGYTNLSANFTKILESFTETVFHETVKIYFKY